MISYTNIGWLLIRYPCKIFTRHSTEELVNTPSYECLNVTPLGHNDANEIRPNVRCWNGESKYLNSREELIHNFLRSWGHWNGIMKLKKIISKLIKKSHMSTIVTDAVCPMQTFFVRIVYTHTHTHIYHLCTIYPYYSMLIIRHLGNHMLQRQ